MIRPVSEIFRCFPVKYQVGGALRRYLQGDTFDLHRLDAVSPLATGPTSNNAWNATAYRGLHPRRRLLTLPNASRARHKITDSGKKEASNTHSVHLQLTELIAGRLACLSELCEILKREGLPPNEVRCVLL
jgi:hypothetical protein